MSHEMFIGCGTALATPFDREGKLDIEGYKRLVQRQVVEGIDFLVPCGTTGESPTLSHDEKLEVVSAALEVSGGKPVLAGAGGYNTAEVIELIGDYEKLGVQGILSVTPYYNKPTQEGLLAHYRALADSTSLPIILYSVQPRTNVNLEVGTVVKLAEVPNIVGIKEASGSLAQVAGICGRVPDDFLVLSGDDAVTLPVISLGGHGLISVVSNQIPGPMAKLVRYALTGDFTAARAINKRFLPLMEVNFIEANPQPLKAAMEMMGLLEANFRLPLVPPKPESVSRIREVLTQVGIL